MPWQEAAIMSSILFGAAATHRRHGSRGQRAGWKPSVWRCFLCFLGAFGESRHERAPSIAGLVHTRVGTAAPTWRCETVHGNGRHTLHVKSDPTPPHCRDANAVVVAGVMLLMEMLLLPSVS